jgi:hypothetical protein
VLKLIDIWDALRPERRAIYTATSVGVYLALSPLVWLARKLKLL